MKRKILLQCVDSVNDSFIVNKIYEGTESWENTILAFQKDRILLKDESGVEIPISIHNNCFWKFKEIKNLPVTWYIKLTEENWDDVVKWHKSIDKISSRLYKDGGYYGICDDIADAWNKRALPEDANLIADDVFKKYVIDKNKTDLNMEDSVLKKLPKNFDIEVNDLDEFKKVLHFLQKKYNTLKEEIHHKYMPSQYYYYIGMDDGKGFYNGDKVTCNIIPFTWFKKNIIGVVEKYPVGSYIVWTKSGIRPMGEVEKVVKEMNIHKCITLNKFGGFDISRFNDGEAKWFATYDEAIKFSEELMEKERIINSWIGIHVKNPIVAYNTPCERYTQSVIDSVSKNYVDEMTMTITKVNENGLLNPPIIKKDKKKIKMEVLERPKLININIKK